jgi:TRAP transporter TAXI family solute receptor
MHKIHWGGAAALMSLLGAAPVIVSGCAEPTVVAERPRAIRIGVGTRGGDFSVMGSELAETLRSEQPQYQVEIVSNGGALSSLDDLQQGASDCSFSYANITYEGFTGRLADKPSPLTHLRGVAVIELTPVYFVTRRGSPVKSVTDLEGRSMSLGPRGSGSYRAAQILLDGFGVDTAKVKMQSERWGASIERMGSGEVDAFFILAGQPGNFRNRVTERTEQEVRPLEGETVDRLRTRYPFLHPVVVPAGTFPMQTKPIRTVGIDSVLLCSDDVPTEDVARVTKDWFSTVARLVKDGRLGDAVTPALASATPIPLHPGAAEYYRARQVQFR